MSCGWFSMVQPSNDGAGQARSGAGTRLVLFLIPFLTFMKPHHIFGLFSIGVLVTGSSCQRDPDPTPLTRGRLVKTETTVDGNLRTPRPRWILDVAPLSFEGSWPSSPSRTCG